MLAPLLLAAALHTIRIDAAANRHPISSEVYGSSFFPGGKFPGANATLTRWGGNATTRYNWQANASNRASDWFFESISEEGANPSAGVDGFIDLAHYAGSEPMITIPTMGWVAKLGPKTPQIADAMLALQDYATLLNKSDAIVDSILTQVRESPSRPGISGEVGTGLRAGVGGG